HLEGEIELYGEIKEQLDRVYEIKGEKDVSQQLQEISNIYSVPVNQIEKTITRFLKETDIKKKKVKNLTEACNDLFNEWKKSQKGKKKVSGGEIEELISNAELITGTEIKIVAGSSSSEATAVAGAITKDNDFVAHIFDGSNLVSMASDNVNIDLREIAPKIGKILGGSGGGKAKMTQCGGPKKDKVKEALEQAKQLTKKKLEKK
ncbi:MAG: hypothetical protein KAS76_06705, partial [Thermoplasmatales archaeon]|nr:hypothetical protein [Thermoplasmatales archaeon]